MLDTTGRTKFDTRKHVVGDLRAIYLPSLAPPEFMLQCSLEFKHAQVHRDMEAPSSSTNLAELKVQHSW